MAHQRWDRRAQPDQAALGCVACAARRGALPCVQAGTIGRDGFLRGLAMAGLAVAGGVAGGLTGPLTGAVAASSGPLARSTGGLWLGNALALPPGRALSYVDPASGDPALLVRLADGRFVSYDAICTHGPACTTLYDFNRRLVVCPCHGATFDPARAAAVLAGPTSIPLEPLRVRIAANGDVFALDARSGVASPAQRLRPAPPYTGQRGDDGGGEGSGGSSDDGISRASVSRRPVLSRRPVRLVSARGDD